MVNSVLVFLFKLSNFIQKISLIYKLYRYFWQFYLLKKQTSIVKIYFLVICNKHLVRNKIVNNILSFDTSQKEKDKLTYIVLVVVITKKNKYIQSYLQI